MGPALIGSDLWDNLTISLYQQQCQTDQWLSVPFSLYPIKYTQSYVQIKFSVKTTHNRGQCQVYYFSYILSSRVNSD